jgi:DNA polymerase
MLHIDYESRSTQDLREVGVWNYANHPETEPLLLGWAYDNEPVEVWEIIRDSMPDKLRKGFEDPNQQLAAFNSTFERYISNFKLGLNLPIERFEDASPSALYLSMPKNLEDVGEILGLPAELAKDKEGKRLLEKFSEPSKRKKKRGEPDEFYFRDWNTDPEDWLKFIEYCRRDVLAEREVMRREKLLGAWPLPPFERKIWLMDQRINDRGVFVDMDFVRKGLKLASQEKEEKIKENDKLTGLENSNSNEQMLNWLLTQGYNGLKPKNKKKGKSEYTIEEKVVQHQLKNNDALTPLARQVLEVRKSASSTSYKKMSAILRQVSPDHRLRNQFIYLGSSRAGRWSGNAVQLHNMARPNEVFEIQDNVKKARAMIFAEDYQGIKDMFGSVLLTVKYNIRTAFIAAPGKRLNVADLNAIETRVGAHVAGCQPLLDVFDSVKYPPKGRDPYLYFAVDLSGIVYEILERDINNKENEVIKIRAKTWRQFGKVGVLQCIYRAGAPGLLAYAERNGIKMTLEDAEKIVKVFRHSFSEIEQIWYAIEDAIKDVLKPGTKRVKRRVGVDGCVKFDKLIFKCNEVPRTILRIQLPSGRFLHYLDARVAPTKMPWQRDGEDVYKPSLCYAGQDQVSKQWIQDITSHGGKVFENIVQGIARDVLATKLLAFEEAGLPVVLHVHDEAGTETDDDPLEPGLEEMNRIMAEFVAWIPSLPLASDGFEGKYYRK